MTRFLTRLAVVAIGVAVLPAGSLNVRAAAGRPMTIDDLIGAIRISDPQLAPDGRSVAFVRTVTDLKTGARNADIWMVSTDGRGEPKELIAGDKSENTPRFSADGKLAFISRVRTAFRRSTSPMPTAAMCARSPISRWACSRRS